MSFIYFLFIKLYVVVAHFLSLFDDKAKKWVEGRKNWRKEYKKVLSNNTKKSIWIHCASLGEFEQGSPIIEQINNWRKEQNKDYQIILTFFSPSGYEAKKNLKIVDHVFYLPIDAKNNAKDFIELINPEVAVFVKYEFWKNYIEMLHDKKIPLFIASAIFRENQFFFQWYGKSFLKTLNKVSHFFVQNIESQNLLQQHGINQVEVAGDTRFDRVFESCQNPKKFEEIELFKADKKLLVAGSTWEKDEEIILDKIDFLLKNNFKIIFAPHEIKPDRIAKLIQLLRSENITFSKWSNLDENFEKSEILVIDTIGILKSLYNYSNISYVGGGFGKGIHNTLEAATFGKPVIFGTNYYKFNEAKDLIKVGGAFSISNSDDFVAIINTLNNKVNIENIFKINKSYIKQNVGATNLIVKKIVENLY